MPGTLIPAPYTYFTDDEGVPLVGGLVYTYITGTSTLTPVYHDAALSDPWDNPFEVPASGKATLYQDTDTIKMVIKDADGNVLETIDPIQSVGSTSSGGSGVSVFTFEGDDYFPITATAIPSGTTVSVIHPGTTFYTVDSADLVGDYVLQGMMQVTSAETVTASLVNLSQGSPDTAIVSITSTSTAGELKTSSVITFAASGTARTYAVKTYTAAGVPSYVWNLSLVRTS